MQQRAKRGIAVNDLVEYRLVRQLRSASAGPKMSRPCKPNFAGLDSSPVLTSKTISPRAQLAAGGLAKGGHLRLERFGCCNYSAAVSPSTASLVRLAEGRRPEAENSSRTRDTGNDFDTHCDNSEQLLALLKSLGWCLKGADHLSLHWRRC
jgi:hypothetical protein